MPEPIAKRIATCFGIGKFRPAPGTWASLIALPFAWGIDLILGPGGLAFASVTVALIGVWAGGAYAAWSGKHDPSEVVIDEVAGQWLAVAIVAAAMGGPTIPALGIAFLTFRFFDILKPDPAGRAQRLRGGWGIVADDMVAGAYAGLATIAVLLLMRWFGSA